MVLLQNYSSTELKFKDAFFKACIGYNLPAESKIMNTARKIFENVPKLPSGGGSALTALVTAGLGSYGLYNSVVTGSLCSMPY